MSASTRDRLRTARLLTDQVRWTALRAKVQHTLRDIDALLPITMLPALAVETVDASMEVYTEHHLQYLRHTAIDNARNLCGLSAPCGFTSQGFPLA
jgi:Asp-tRNA(Asn)/Glu-tRNA(Gln) amidotransferase A subunit family amidase